MEQLIKFTAWQLSEMLAKGQISSVDLVKAILGNIDNAESTIGAYLSIRDNRALLREAAQVDSLRLKKKLPPLAGIPIAIKDNIAVRGEPMTCGSKILENFVSPYDAHVISRLRRRKLLILGKTNMDEFGMGSSTENSAFKVTRNPRAVNHVPGGTSGGSAAAVAANEAILALGSDTGGSIRQPAALCGVVGLKPTYGLVSRFGLAAYASSLEQIGPLTKDVRDSALLLEAIAGFDKRDSTSASRPPKKYLPDLDQSETRKRVVVGLPVEYFGPGLDSRVRNSLERTIATLGAQGFEFVEITLPHTEAAIAAYYIIASAEASSNLSRYDGVRFGRRVEDCETADEMITRSRTRYLGAEVKRRIMLGTFVLSAGYFDAYYTKAQKVRRLLLNDFITAFSKCDILLHPISPTPAWEIGTKTFDPIQMYLSDVFSVTASLTGLPGIAMPCGITPDGLPIGMQLTGPHFDEKKLIEIGARIEDALGPQLTV